ncbi:hypothetical protein D3C87_1885970 [compost metagenome]
MQLLHIVEGFQQDAVRLLFQQRRKLLGIKPLQLRAGQICPFAGADRAHCTDNITGITCGTPRYPHTGTVDITDLGLQPELRQLVIIG